VLDPTSEAIYFVIIEYYQVRIASKVVFNARDKLTN
jgi:hypothetical protein